MSDTSQPTQPSKQARSGWRKLAAIAVSVTIVGTSCGASVSAEDENYYAVAEAIDERPEEDLLEGCIFINLMGREGIEGLLPRRLTEQRLSDKVAADTEAWKANMGQLGHDNWGDLIEDMAAGTESRAVASAGFLRYLAALEYFDENGFDGGTGYEAVVDRTESMCE